MSIRRKCSLRTFPVLLLLGSFPIGCASTGDAESEQPINRTMDLDPSLPRSQRIIGLSVEGREIETVMYGDGAEVVLILASIHGSEPAGTPLVERFAEYLRNGHGLPTDRTIIIVPRVNPDGLAHGTRHNARGVDLNRNFPADNFRSKRRFGSSPLSEPESRAVLDLIKQYQPARIITIHQPIGCIDYDGPADELAQAMSAACDLPVSRLGTRPGSLGAYAGKTLGIPIITVELPGSASNLPGDELWDRYGPMLQTAVAFP